MIHNLTPKPAIQVQRGQTCKLYALSNAMEWLNTSYSAQQTPPPVRRVQPNASRSSLRRRAKEVINSQVGEVYGDLNLLNLAQDSGFNNFKSIPCSTVDEFCETIKLSLDQNLIPIVVFDVRVTGYFAGQPFNDNGLHEHAVIVHGYYYTPERNLRFKVGQWGKEYDFSAVELAQSNFQLQEVRQPETFIKIGNRWSNIEDTMLAGQNQLDPPRAYIRRATQSTLETHGTFKQRVIIGAPNGIDYNFRLQNVRPPISNRTKLFFVGSLTAIVLSIYLISFFTTVGAIAIAAVAASSLVGLYVAKWRKALSPIYRRILEVNLNSVQKLHQATPDHEPVAYETMSRTFLNNFKPQRSTIIDRPNEGTPESCRIQEEANQRMPLSQLF